MGFWGWVIAAENAAMLAAVVYIRVSDRRMMRAVVRFWTQHPMGTTTPTNLVTGGRVLLAPGVVPAEVADRYGMAFAEILNGGPSIRSDEAH